MEAALAALCRGGGWSYAAVWRFHPHDPRLLTLGESYCEDEATSVVEKMLTQVHIVGEGVVGEAIVSGNYKWVFSDTWHDSDQTKTADNQGLFQGHTWWQHQFLNGIKTIAILPLQAQGIVQFGSVWKVPRNSDFLNQVRYMFEQMKDTSRDHPTVYTQINSPTYGQQTILNSLGSTNVIHVQNKAITLQNEKLEDSIEQTKSRRSSIYSPLNSQSSLNDLISQGTGNTTMHTQMPALPANESACEIRELDNVGDFLNDQHSAVTTPLQVIPSRKLDSTIASLMSYKNLNSLHEIEKESFGQNMPDYPSHQYSTTDSPDSGLEELCYSGAGFSSLFATVYRKVKKCLQNDSENLLHNSISFSNSPCISKIQENSLARKPVLVHEQLLIPDPQECLSHLSPEEYFIVQNDLMQLKDATQTTCEASSAIPELPSRTTEEATAGTSDHDMKECDANNGLLESMMLDLSTSSFVQNWWDEGSVSQAANLRNLSNTHSESVSDKHSLSMGNKVFPDISVIEQFLGGDAHKPAGHISPVMKASDLTSGISKQLPHFAFQDNQTAHSAHVPSLACGYYTSKNAQNGSSKVTSVPSEDIPVDGSCSLDTENSKGSQSNNPDGVKVAKKRARAGESTRPRPKDRQLIQDRVKELRGMVPNGAKCSIDALLDRTVKHMLFLQSVTKYADKIKQADEPEMIDKESGVILKENTKPGKNGGATWAYEVVGQTMACPIIIEDLSPPGQMLVEMLCEERGFFLEIADNIRGFGLMILKGLMEARDGKIWARFLVEANRDVTRMDVFLSLVQLLEQNSLVAFTDQVTKVMNNRVPSFADHQRSSLPVPVGVAERLQ